MISSAQEFADLCASNDAALRERASKENALPTTWLQVLDLYPDLKIHVIWNKTVPIEILRVLARDSDAEVRFWVAMKRKLDDELLTELARDPDERVRNRIANNAKTPMHVLEALAADASSVVSESARQRLGMV
jgi:hypothetical protein